MTLPKSRTLLLIHNCRYSASLLAEEKIRQEIRHVLVEFILRGQEHRLVVDQKQQQIEKEEEDNARDHDNVRGDAVLLGCHAVLAVQRLQQVAEASSDAVALGKWVSLAISRQLACCKAGCAFPQGA